jgi:BirA family biotin operon repressor/biotin-[acetyl-CoA-carboxylase] ligase
MLVDPGPFETMPQLGFVAGLALIRAIRPLIGNDEELAIKWPNDLLHGDAKFAGLLLEGARLADGRSVCVIGFGVNCVSHPDVAYPTTDLARIGASCSAADVFEALSHEWPLWLARWERGAAFAKIRDAWLANARGLNDPIRVARGAESLAGVFQTIDMQGRLVIGTEQGPRTIEAGDVFLLDASSRARPSVGEKLHG